MLAFIFLLLFSNKAHSQSSEQTRLQIIEVTSWSEPQLSETLTPTYIVGEEKLGSAPLINSALQNVPGVYATQNGGVGGRSSFSFRGAEGRHNLVTIQGVRLNDPSGTDRQFDFAFLQSSSFSKMILLKGAAPVLFGGDATAGLIELVPRKNVEGKLETRLGLGSFETRDMSVGKGWKSGVHSGVLQINYLKSLGFSRLNKKRFKAKERDGIEEWQMLSTTDHQWKDNIASETLIMYNHANADQDGLNVDSKGDKTKNQQIVLSQRSHIKLNDQHDVVLRTSLNHHARKLIQTQASDETYRGQNREAQMTVNSKMHRVKLKSSLGMDQEWFSYSQTSTTFDRAYAFVDSKYSLTDQLQVAAGIREEHHQRYGFYHGSELALRYQSSQRLNLYMKYATGYKPPSLYQLYAPDFFGFPVGNKNLKPERNESQEIGARYQHFGKWELTFFKNHFSHLLQYSSTDGYLNGGQFIPQGLEASWLTPEQFWGQLRFDYTHLDFLKTVGPVLRRPRNTTGVSYLYYVEDNWGGELNVKTISSRNDQASGQKVKLNSYDLLGLQLFYRQTNDLEWRLRIDNLLGREYEDIYGYSVSPRSFYVSMVFRQ